jgi:hypothetical protein
MPPALLDATTTADVVKLPARTVLAIDGVGAPEDRAFERSIAAVYGIAYTLKFARKKVAKADFKIGPLEGRWWADEPGKCLADVPRSSWHWELRIAVPRTATEPEVERAIIAARAKKGGKLEASMEVTRVHLARLPEARYGRVLHVGPYAREGESFARIVEMVEHAGLRAGTSHIEIYLNDPRRVQPDRLKTVLLLELAP